MPNLLNWFAQQIAAALCREMGPKWDIVGQGEINGIVGLENYQQTLNNCLKQQFLNVSDSFCTHS
jgi:hypothetical protein